MRVPHAGSAAGIYIDHGLRAQDKALLYPCMLSVTAVDNVAAQHWHAASPHHFVPQAWQAFRRSAGHTGPGMLPGSPGLCASHPARSGLNACRAAASHVFTRAFLWMRTPLVDAAADPS